MFVVELLTVPLGQVVVLLAELMRSGNNLFLDAQYIWRGCLDISLRVDTIVNINDEDSFRDIAGWSSSPGDWSSPPAVAAGGSFFRC